VEQSGEFHTDALMAVPMVTKDRVVGVLEVINKRDGTPFNVDDQNLLSAFATTRRFYRERAAVHADGSGFGRPCG